MNGMYDKAGEPIDNEEFCRLLGDFEYRRVGDDTVGSVRVSTVWLGLDHSWGNGSPLIFETMVFGGPDDGWQERYATEEQAIAGHARAVETVSAGRRLDDDALRMDGEDMMPIEGDR